MNLRKFRYIKRLTSFILAICMMLSMVSLAVYSKDTEDTEELEEIPTIGALEETEEGLVEIVFAKTSIRKGAKFTEKNVELVKVDEARVPKGAVKELKDVVGKYAAAAIAEGEYVYDGAIAKSRVQDSKADSTYVNVADYVNPDLGEDVSDDLQKVIEKNPKRTIYFPDGEYLISKSLITYGDPQKAVSLLLADGAVIKATDDWETVHGLDCLISYGAYNGYNTEISETTVPLSDVVSTGSYFWIQGGTFDGNGKAGGISLDGGRETLVKNVVIKNVNLGIRVNKGVNNKSSDMDVDDVVIQCTGAEGSVGVEVLGYDNTFTNIRIYNAHKGVSLPRYDHTSPDGTVFTGISSGGNAFRNIYIIRGSAPYSNSFGVHEDWHANFFYHCYIENYATGMRLRGVDNIMDSCSIQWTKNEGSRCAFTTISKFEDTLSACRITSGVTLNSSSGSAWSDYLIRN